MPDATRVVPVNELEPESRSVPAPLFTRPMIPCPLSWIVPAYVGSEPPGTSVVSVRVPPVAAVVMAAPDDPLRAPTTRLNVPVSSVPPLSARGVTAFPNAAPLPATSRPAVSVMPAPALEPESVRVPVPPLTSVAIPTNLPPNVEVVVAATVSVPKPVITPPTPPLRLPTVGDTPPKSSVPEPTVSPVVAGPSPPG